MEEGHSSGLLKQCHCNLCQGAKWWHKSTVYRHLNDQILQGTSVDVAEETSRTEEDEQMVEDNEVFAEDVEHMVDDDDVVLARCFANFRSSLFRTGYFLSDYRVAKNVG